MLGISSRKQWRNSMKYSDLTEAIENIKYALKAIESQDFEAVKACMLDVLDTLESEL